MRTTAMPSRVLVVDDEPVTANLYALTLENAGYSVRLAGSSEEALDALSRNRFELVLLDLYFPGMGGWELLSRLRDRFASDELPVIMLSGEGNASVRTSLLGMGANDFLMKPVMPAILLEAVRLWTTTQSRRLQPSGAAEPLPPHDRNPHYDDASTRTLTSELSSREPRTILVVDDDPIFFDILSKSVGASGFGIECASSVASCLKRIDAAGEADAPAVLMIDIFMPYADGFDLMRGLAARKCTVPLIIVTGVGPEYLRAATELGRVWGLNVLDTMMKPLEIERLRTCLDSLRTPTRNDTRKLVVLVVEDDENARTIPVMTFVDAGCEVLDRGPKTRLPRPGIL